MSDTRTEFTLTADHVTLLRRANVAWEGDEYGAPEIDPKRPYGNSGVAEDIADLLGWPCDNEEGQLTDAQRAAARAIHLETAIALQIILVTGAFTLGTYHRPSPYSYRGWALRARLSDGGQP